MRKSILIAGFAALALLCACNPGITLLDAFAKDDTIRLELDGEKVFIYDETTCQLSFNRQRASFRCHTDTMLDYFVVEMDAMPRRAGDSATANVYWSTSEGERSRKNITLEAKLIKGDLIWLCDESKRTAAVVRVLE
ncbi:MAG: hypothetical protein J5640_06640 [Bacteroidales bacterium]|nr:hypothetical protein [Bacteroidales bacterium]